MIDMDDDMDRKVPTSNSEHFSATKRDPMAPADAKYLRLAILGAPNAGKSELTNQLVGASVSAVSAKIDTTRMTTTGVVTDRNTQLVILDNPGIVSRQRARDVIRIDPDHRMVTDPETSVEKADVIAVLFDATAPGDYIHHRILHILHRHMHVPSILVVNKIDLITDRPQLLELIRILTKGQVGGQPINAVRKTIGRLGSKLASKTVPLHLAGQKDKDPKWHQLYSRLLGVPTHRVSTIFCTFIYRSHFNKDTFKTKSDI
uniref:GTPase Era, mitochondrial n=1 Tax=Plectus sambesii TaxID=2011161 RepID=A0A914VGW5_9BILA